MASCLTDTKPLFNHPYKFVLISCLKQYQAFTLNNASNCSAHTCGRWNDWNQNDKICKIIDINHVEYKNAYTLVSVNIWIQNMSYISMNGHIATKHLPRTIAVVRSSTAVFSNTTWQMRRNMRIDVDPSTNKRSNQYNKHPVVYKPRNHINRFNSFI